MALVFGYLTDLGVWVIQGIPVPSYGVRWLLCLAGVFLVGVGVALEVVAGVVTLARGGVRAGGVPGDPLSLWEP